MSTSHCQIPQRHRLTNVKSDASVRKRNLIPATTFLLTFLEIILNNKHVSNLTGAGLSYNPSVRTKYKFNLKKIQSQNDLKKGYLLRVQSTAKNFFKLARSFAKRYRFAHRRKNTTIKRFRARRLFFFVFGDNCIVSGFAHTPINILLSQGFVGGPVSQHLTLLKFKVTGKMVMIIAASRHSRTGGTLLILTLDAVIILCTRKNYTNRRDVTCGQWQPVLVYYELDALDRELPAMYFAFRSTFYNEILVRSNQ